MEHLLLQGPVINWGIIVFWKYDFCVFFSNRSLIGKGLYVHLPILYYGCKVWWKGMFFKGYNQNIFILFPEEDRSLFSGSLMI